MCGHSIGAFSSASNVLSSGFTGWTAYCLCLKAASGRPRLGRKQAASASADSQHGHCLRLRHSIIGDTETGRECLDAVRVDAVYITHIAFMGLQHQERCTSTHKSYSTVLCTDYTWSRKGAVGNVR